MKHIKHFLLNYWLLLVEAVVVICQAGIDGRYIRSFYPPGLIGSILGFGLNLGVDITSGVLGYEFTRHQQNARKSDRRTKLLAWILLVGEFGLLYFAIVFSHRQLELVLPNEPPYLLWSLSAFAPSGCLLLGVAQALRDGKFEQATVKQPSSKPKQSIQITEPAIPILAYHCRYCDATYDTIKALNGHMKAHPIAERGNGHVEKQTV